MRHGYKSKALGVYFEKAPDGKWKALWFCKTTGTVLNEMRVNDV